MAVDPKGIEATLVSIHAMLAAYTQTPELLLTSDESGALAEAVANVAQFYPAVALPPQLMAWVGLVAVGSKIYGPRIGQIRRKAREKKAHAAPPA